MALVRLADTATNREVVRWTVAYPVLVVLPLAAIALVYPLAAFGLLGVAFVAGAAFGFMGEDFRAQAMVDRTYHLRSDTAVGDDDNPDERAGNLHLLRFTGGLTTLALVTFGLLLVAVV